MKLAAAFLLSLALIATSWSQAASARPAAPEADRQLAYEIFKQLIETNTSHSVGSVTVAAQEMRARLLAAGFPAEDLTIAGPSARKQNLVVRYRGSGQKQPILIFGHLDVVEASRSDWQTDPFQLVEKDGYFYGRGTQDIKENDAMLVAAFIRLRREGYRPQRDMILALTADEEIGTENGMQWLTKNRPDLIKAEYAINVDAGGVETDHGKPVMVEVEASEKIYADFLFAAADRGGHSSLPHPGNPIDRLAAGLIRLEQTPFPFELNPITRGLFAHLSTQASPADAAAMHAILQQPPDQAALQRLAGNVYYNALLRTTCIPTMFSGGEAKNALPQNAKVNVNCRIMPGHTPEEIRQELVKVVADPQISVHYLAADGHESATAPNEKQFAPPPDQPEVMQRLERVAGEFWPGAPVVQELETGASDSVYTMAIGLPSYGIGGTAIDQDDVRAHGRDERVRVSSFYDGAEFTYLFLKSLGSPANEASGK